jgi:CheY-like chemotaxis protein
MWMSIRLLKVMETRLLHEDDQKDMTKQCKLFAQTDQNLCLQTQQKYRAIEQILLVEDNLIAQKATKFVLEQLCCSLDFAATGAEAIALATANRYDIIFMDIGLPDTSGLEVTVKIRHFEQQQQLPAAPIFALTAHTDPNYHQHCAAVGFNAVLTKPLLHKHKAAILMRYRDIKSHQEPLPIIDWKQTDQLANGNKVNTRQLLEKTLQALSTEKNNIQVAFANQEPTMLLDAINRLRNISSRLGTPELNLAVLTCEFALHAQEELSDCFDYLITSINNLLQECQQTRNTK